MKRLTTVEIDEYAKNLPTNLRGGKEFQTKMVSELFKYKWLEEHIGCPLDVYVQLKYDTSIFDQNGDKWFVEAISKHNVIHAVRRAEKMRLDDIWFSVSDHKKTWWLKADRSE